MLVTRVKGTHRRFASDDAGSTLIVVLIVMLVLAVGATALAGIIVNTTGTLVSSRDRVQAQAAVDAGIAAQTIRLESGDLPCAASSQNGVPVDSASGPKYDYILHQCGGGTATLEVRAQIAGASVARQAVFRYDPAPAPAAKEPALVTRAPLNLEALTIKSVNAAEPATVWVVPDAGVAGDFQCNAGGSIAGSVYLPAGTVLGKGGCEVKGDVYAENDVSIGSGTTIRGDVVSLNGSVTVSGGNTVDGSIYAKVDVKGSGLSSRFVKSIYAGRDVDLAGGTPVARDSITYGRSFIHPANPADAGWAVKSVTKGAITMPKLPTTPKWEGFTQTDLDALVTAGKYVKIPWKGSCRHSYDHQMKAVIEGLTVPTLIDARTCADWVELPAQWGQLKLSTDVIFVAPSFDLVGQNLISGDGNEHRIWFIAPEATGRNCSTATPVNMQGVKMSPIGSSKISGMVFTQCTVYFANASEEWQGSIHAGKMTGKPNFWYKPVGFPGRELAGGGSGGESGSGSKLSGLTVVSNRDLK